MINVEEYQSNIKAMAEHITH